jgi:hypothetical protein
MCCNRASTKVPEWGCPGLLGPWREAAIWRARKGSLLRVCLGTFSCMWEHYLVQITPANLRFYLDPQFHQGCIWYNDACDVFVTCMMHQHMHVSDQPHVHFYVARSRSVYTMCKSVFYWKIVIEKLNELLNNFKGFIIYKILKENVK